jgi:hypothetical protein
LSGYLRIGIEGSLGAWPGDNSNQCAQGYNCPPPTLPALDPFVPAGNRYIDISSGGPNYFTWKISADAPWVKFSITSGTVGADPKEQRVFVSVDWAQAKAATQSAVITVSAQSTGQQDMSTTVLLTALSRAPAADFKGKIYVGWYCGLNTNTSQDSYKGMVSSQSKLLMPPRTHPRTA